LEKWSKHEISKLSGKWINYDMMAIIPIVFLGIYFFAKIILLPYLAWGESDDFKIATISVVNHFSTTITNDDIEQFKIEFPEEESILNKNFPTFNGKLISFYFPTYSIACLPLKTIISIFPFNIPLNYSFLLTNLLCYFGTLVFVFYRLNGVPKLNRMIMLLLLAFSPAMEYINIPHYEVFLYSLLACSAVQLYKKAFKSAALFGSIAASTNIALSGFLFFIVVAYLYNLFKSYKINFWLKACLLNIKDIILFAFCCLPVLLQLTYFKILIGQFSPQQHAFSEFSGIIPRFLAYFFDYNFSFLAYYPLLVILFFLCLVYYVYKKDYDKIFFGCGILLSMLLYSIMVHINCGQQSLHRYDTHLLGPLLMFPSLIGFSLFPVTIIYASVVSFFLVNGIYLINSPLSYVVFFPIPKAILNTIPQIYNPYPYTFISRTQHVDGGYWDLHEKPYFYLDNKGYIRKVLVTKESSLELLNSIEQGKIVGSTSDIMIFKKKITALKYRRYKNTSYINLNRGIDIRYIE
jgi:hypothetical protein